MEVEAAMDPIAWNARQLDCVNYTGEYLLVSGPPGAGKTLVLLARARRLAEELASANSGAQRDILVFTYNKTLARYADELLALNGVSSTVQTTTFHKWAYGQLVRAGLPHKVIAEQEQREVLQRVLAQQRTEGTPSPLLSRRVNWWRDELYWIKGQVVRDWEAYRDVTRTGRGDGLREAARRVVWDVYECYQRELGQRGLVDYPDYALHLLAHWARYPSHPRVPHVLVDEAQDLRLAELQVLAQLGQQVTIVADRKQKIYRTGFAWKDLGVDFVGRAKVLTTCYRTTRQVAALATQLLTEDPLVRPGDIDFGPGELPEKEGPLPVLVSVRDPREEDRVAVQLVEHLRRVREGRTVGILGRQWSTLERIASALKRAAIPHELFRDGEGSIVEPGVKLLTFHSAKGLEFGDVIVVGLSEGVFPPAVSHEVAIDAGESEQDFLSTERRLLYVAMTRTRRGLYLIAGRPPTRFLAELDESLYTTTASELVSVSAPAAGRA